jgi:hypothetical protein
MPRKYAHRRANAKFWQWLLKTSDNISHEKTAQTPQKTETIEPRQGAATPNHEDGQEHKDLELATLIPVLILCGQSSNTDWQGLLHGIGLILTGVFACIAAFSSLHNGKTLRDGGGPSSTQNDRPRKSNSKKGAAADWYKPPDV